LIPTSIITGYLGSGKTTFLKRVIEQSDRRIAIVMNEFGELKLEGKLLKGKNVNMVELEGGCVCCSLAGEFELAIKEIVNTIKPDMILVEATGIAEPDSLVTLFQQSLNEVSLDSIITIVDAYGMIKYPVLGHTGRIQIEMGDVIIINKIDLVKEEEVMEVERKVKEINPRALILKAIRCNVDVKYVLGLKMDHFVREHKAHEVEEDIFSFMAKGSLDREAFEEFLSNLPKEVYRMKGSVIFKDGNSYFINYVIDRYDLEPLKADEIKLIFLGRDISKRREEIVEKLERMVS